MHIDEFDINLYSNYDFYLKYHTGLLKNDTEATVLLEFLIVRKKIRAVNKQFFKEVQ